MGGNRDEISRDGSSGGGLLPLQDGRGGFLGWSRARWEEIVMETNAWRGDCPDCGVAPSNVADHVCIESLQRQLTEAREETRRWSLALQSLTPGGSEYVDDPERCVATVRDMRDSQHRVILKKAKQLREVREESASWRRVAERLEAEKVEAREEIERKIERLKEDLRSAVDCSCVNECREEDEEHSWCGGCRSRASIRQRNREWWITLRCPRCKREKDVPRDTEYEPEEAAALVVHCPECAVRVGANQEQPLYLDSEGNEVDHDTD